MPSGTESSDKLGGGFWLAGLIGLAPLLALVVVAAASVVLTIVARQLTLGQGFFVEQRITALVLGAGLALAALVYVIGCVRTLRRARAWQAAGDAARAAGTLWALGITAVLVVVPVVVAVLLPQHPAR